MNSIENFKTKLEFTLNNPGIKGIILAKMNHDHRDTSV